ncbi:MAG: ABC transporter ATP-binding protein [Candidatus Electrothrix sp. Rat3]|nr:ABC transporter ATP-binding protein [Candidatus Electrothrix rattekaaiensis]
MTAPTFSLPGEVIWPLSALHEAIPLLAERSSLLSGAAQDRTELRTGRTPPPLPDDFESMEELTSWLENTSQRLGLEVVAVETTYPDQEDLLLHATPALLLLPDEGELSELAGSFVLLVSSRRRTLRLLKQDGRLYHLPVHRLRDILVSKLEAPLKPMVDTLLEQVNIREQQRDKVRRALLREYLSGAKVEGCWMLRLPPSASFIHQLRRARFPKKVVGLVCATLAARLLILIASFLIGKTILQGSVGLGDFQLWGLLLFTVIPMHLVGMQLKNRLSLHFGVLLRNRLLHGILQLRPEEIQHQGSGHFIGNVQEIEQLEAMGMSAAFMACTSFLEVLIAAVVLMQGAGGLLHGMLLLGWSGMIFLLGWMYYLRMRDWLIHSRVMTCDLVERMVGHRTRLAQERPEQLHEIEDQLLSRYAMLSERLDNMEVIMKSAAGRRGWLPVSLLGTLAMFFSTGVGVSTFAVSLGGTLLAALALDQLVQSIYQFLKTVMSWEQVHPLYEAACRERIRKVPQFIPATCLKQKKKKHPLIQAEKLSFSYPNSGKEQQVILDQCDLTMKAGQYVLLEGASGCGKSTLALLLSGLQHPDSGSLHLFGFSLASLGEEAWRKRVVIAPQFHQNYVLTETLAFNLLMGRGWPPSQKDLMEAETVCRELGLADLLEAMPSGLQQMVGEGGWRLSHGERTRLFIARTLLQQADLIILDESFAALDPETLQIALSCVLRRAKALLLIAHP